MPCSAVTLSLATIAGVVSAALLAIAVGTDNWQFTLVDRVLIESQIVNSSIDPDQFSSSGIYFTRTQGLFRVCYPEAVPKKDGLHLSPVETKCEYIDYHIFDEDADTTLLQGDEMTRLHLARTLVALFVVAFFFLLLAFFTGVAGCWRRSVGNVAATAFLMLTACIFAGAAMAVWHTVEYYEAELRVHPHMGSWDELLKAESHTVYDWSYFVAWIAVGWSLMSSLLFFGASVCLNSESNRHEAKNMPYAVAVYPQKAQYPANYGYNYGYQYPPPQYAGHYNY